MSRILIIEPFKNLRQALALAFFPDHEVKAAARLADWKGDELEAFDLVIIDATALREGHADSGDALRTIEGSQVPTLWLTDDEGAPAPNRSKLQLLKTPVEREALRSAVETLLSSGPSKQPAKREDPAPPSQGAGGKAEKTADVTDQESFDFIELVDVVDDPSQPGQSKKQPRKPK